MIIGKSPGQLQLDVTCQDAETPQSNAIKGSDRELPE